MAQRQRGVHLILIAAADFMGFEISLFDEVGDDALGGAFGDADAIGDIAQPVRAALTGTNVSPPIFEVMQVLGRDETLGRIADAMR
jgi:glutamyl-tRNA synthetase